MELQSANQKGTAWRSGL